MPLGIGSYRGWHHFRENILRSFTGLFLVGTKVGWDCWHVGGDYQGRAICCIEGGNNFF